LRRNRKAVVMAKKEPGMKSHTLLKAWGTVAFLGLFAYLVTYDENHKPLSTRKKPWQILLIALGIAILSMGALVGLYLLLRHFFFPTFILDTKWAILISCAIIVVIGTIITAIEARQRKMEQK